MLLMCPATREADVQRFVAAFGAFCSRLGGLQ
jgi:hypothetical protein